MLSDFCENKNTPVENSKGVLLKKTYFVATPGIFKHPWAPLNRKKPLASRIDANIGFVFAPMQRAQTLAKIPKVKASCSFRLVQR